MILKLGQVPPQVGALDDDKQQLFTFYRDISQNPALIEMTINIQNSVQKVFQGGNLELIHSVVVRKSLLRKPTTKDLFEDLKLKFISGFYWF